MTVTPKPTNPSPRMFVTLLVPRLKKFIIFRRLIRLTLILLIPWLRKFERSLVQWARDPRWGRVFSRTRRWLLVNQFRLRVIGHVLPQIIIVFQFDLNVLLVIRSLRVSRFRLVGGDRGTV